MKLNFKFIWCEVVNSPIIFSRPNRITNLAKSFALIVFFGWQQMSSFAMSLPCFSCTRSITPKHIYFVSSQTEMVGIYTRFIITNMVKYFNIFINTYRNWSNKPSIYQSMYQYFGSLIPKPTVSPFVFITNPLPALINSTKFNFSEYMPNSFRIKFIYMKCFISHCIPILPKLGIEVNSNPKLKDFIKKFWPIPGWTEQNLNALHKFGQ